MNGEDSRGLDYDELAKKAADLEMSNELKIFTNDKRMTFGSNPKPATLTVYFQIKDAFEELDLRLPRGYRKHVDPDKRLGCGVYAVGKTSAADVHSESQMGQDFSDDVKAQHIVPYIEHCHVDREMTKDDGVELPQVHVRITLKINFPARLGPDVALPGEVLPRWWCFAMHITNPEVNPSVTDNWFSLQYNHRAEGMHGDTLLQGWQILGDWDCVYSDWEGWGNCPAKCGGSMMRLTRRVLLEPPPRVLKKSFPKECPGPLEKEVPCNEFPCKFPCELVEVGKPGVCSAECGGGVRAVRWMWRGENCPKEDDEDAVQYEPCNPQPCKARCKLADTWTVVTGCSEVCGQGTYRMMREVLQKDQDDPACQPEWREVKCVRQWCAQLSIIRPDRNILPYPGETYYVGIAFKLTFPVQKITINAPGGYSFGVAGSDCELHDHDLFPWFRSCKVGVQYAENKWEEPRSITLDFNGLLDKNENGRYSFTIPVVNANCPMNRFEQVVQVGETPGPLEVCKSPFDQNLWEMQLTRDLTAEGHSKILELWAPGYELHNPKESHKEVVPGGKDLYWDTSNDGSFVSTEKSGAGSAWRARVVFCSPRLEPCPNGEVCPRSGVCPMTDFGQFDGDDHVVQDGSWTLNAEDTVVRETEDNSQSIESDELEASDEASAEDQD